MDNIFSYSQILSTYKALLSAYRNSKMTWCILAPRFLMKHANSAILIITFETNCDRKYDQLNYNEIDTSNLNDFRFNIVNVKIFFFFLAVSPLNNQKLRST